jgi:hypothetical protein
MGTSSQRTASGLPLQPHPLADAATLRCKLARASLRGEGWGEGRYRRYVSAYARRREPMVSVCKARVFGGHGFPLSRE